MERQVHRLQRRPRGRCERVRAGVGRRVSVRFSTQHSQARLMSFTRPPTTSPNTNFSGPKSCPVGSVLASSRMPARRAEIGSTRPTPVFVRSARIVISRRARFTSRHVSESSSPRRHPVSSAAMITRCKCGAAFRAHHAGLNCDRPRIARRRIPNCESGDGWRVSGSVRLLLRHPRPHCSSPRTASRDSQNDGSSSATEVPSPSRADMELMRRAGGEPPFGISLSAFDSKCSNSSDQL